MPWGERSGGRPTSMPWGERSGSRPTSRIVGFPETRLHRTWLLPLLPHHRMAAVSAATNAELLDDDDVDFGRGDYDDDYGDWDGGDTSTLTAVGACVSMAATAAGNTQNLDGYDSKVIYVPLLPPGGPSKRSLPSGFVHLSEVIKLRFLSKLDSNSSAANVDSFGKDTLKRMLEDIVGEKEYLLQYTAQVDPIFQDLIDNFLPDCVTARMKKKE